MVGDIERAASALGTGLKTAAGGVRTTHDGSPVAYGSLRAAICTVAR
jgi:hypothetical protein